MYDGRIKKMLEEAGVAVYDEVELKLRDAQPVRCMIMPRDRQNPDCLVVKLSSGYNVGYGVDRIDAIKLIKKFERKQVDGLNCPDLKQSSNSEKRLILLGCGGTISSKVEYSTGAAYPSISAEELLLDFPELKEIADIDGKMLFRLLSEDMSPKHWAVIAREIYEAMRTKDYDGIVLMHGTDTMSYTSAALSFMLGNISLPVVLTGAQRSSDRGSSDNKVNLISSCLAACSDICEITVCMHKDLNDEYCVVHRGTRVRKMHTSRRDAFQSIGIPPLAHINYWTKEIVYGDIPYRRKTNCEPSLDTRMNTNVAMVYVYPGIKKEFFRSLSTYDGIVLLGTGLGHVPTNAFNDPFSVGVLQELKDLINSGVAVVMTPQTIYGRIDMSVYTTGRLLLDAGVIGNHCDMLPETAYVKLMWVLGHTKDLKKVKDEMETDFAGEITEKSGIF